MARIPGKTNYTKLVYQAQKTKSKFKKAEIEAYAKWQKKLGRNSKKLDTIDDNLRKLLKALEEAQKQKTEDVKMQARFAKMVGKMFEELQTYKSIPVKEKLPGPPVNTTAISAFCLVVTAWLIYLAAVKLFMAKAEASDTP